MSFEVEEMRKQIFGDDRNEFLLKSIFRNIELHLKHGPDYSDPVIRQTGRTTLRILEGINLLKKNPHLRQIYFRAHNSEMSNRMVSSFIEYAKKLKIDLTNMHLNTRKPGEMDDHGSSYCLYVDDHSMP